jgi:hypothetical protein
LTECAIHQAVGGGIGLKTIRRAAEDLAIEAALALENDNLLRAARTSGGAARLSR